MELRNRNLGGRRDIDGRITDVSLGPTVYAGERYSKASERLKRQNKNGVDVTGAENRVRARTPHSRMCSVVIRVEGDLRGCYWDLMAAAGATFHRVPARAHDGVCSLLLGPVPIGEEAQSLERSVARRCSCDARRVLPSFVAF